MARSREERMRQRRLAELSPANDRMSQADKRFFERFPARQHRVRIAHRAEVEAGAVVNGLDLVTLPSGFRHFVAVKSIAPVCRLRLGFIGLEGSETDLSEEYARKIFEAAKAQNIRAVEVEEEFTDAFDGRPHSEGGTTK